MGWHFTDKKRLAVYDAWEAFSVSDSDDDSLDRFLSVVVPVAAKSHEDCCGAHIVDNDGTVTCLHNGAFIE